MSALSNYDDEVDAISRTGRTGGKHNVRKFFLVHPNQYHLVPTEALLKIPDLSSRKVYFCPLLNHIVTCEEGEFENDEGIPAPEFDCVVDLEEISIGDVILKDSQNSPESQPVQAEVPWSAPPSTDFEIRHHIAGVHDPQLPNLLLFFL